MSPSTPWGAGEISSIYLAKEIDADRLLLDDYKARRVADQNGVRVLYARNYLTDLRHAFRQLIVEGRTSSNAC